MYKIGITRGTVDEEYPRISVICLDHYLRLIEMIRRFPFVNDEAMCRVYCENTRMQIYASQAARDDLLERIRAHYYACIQKQCRQMYDALRKPLCWNKRGAYVPVEIADLVINHRRTMNADQSRSLLTRLKLAITMSDLRYGNLHDLSTQNDDDMLNYRNLPGYRLIPCQIMNEIRWTIMDEDVLNPLLYGHDFCELSEMNKTIAVLENPLTKSLICDWFSVMLYLAGAVSFGFDVMMYRLGIQKRKLEAIARGERNDYPELYDEMIWQYRAVPGHAAICMDLGDYSYWVNEHSNDEQTNTRIADTDVFEYLFGSMLLYEEQKEFEASHRVDRLDPVC